MNIKNKKLILAMIMAFLMRLVLLKQPPWYDELFTHWLATLPLDRLLLATAADVHPPLYYLSAHFSVMAFGSSMWAVRLPAFIFSLLAVYVAVELIYFIPLPSKARDIAILLIIILPSGLYYAVEARMYTILLFAVLWSTLSAYKNQPYTLGIAVAIGMLSHNLMALYIPFILIIWLKNRPKKIKVLQMGGLSLALYIPWLPLAYSQINRLNNDYWILPPTKGRIATALVEILINLPPPELVFHAPIVFLVFLLIGVAVAIELKQYDYLMLAFGPLVLAVLISVVAQPIFIARLLIGTSPFLIILLGLACHYLLKLPLVPRLFALSPFSVVLVLILFNFYISPIRSDLREAYNAAKVQKGDICYHLEPGTLIMAKYYHPDCNHFIWDTTNRGADSLSNITLDALGHSLRPNIDDILIIRGKTWLFHSTSPTTPKTEKNELNRILSHYQTEEIHHKGNGITSRTIWKLNRRPVNETEY